MGWETGRRRVGGCALCRSSVEQRELSDGRGFLFWLSVPHEASCGAPCIGGGTQRPRESHGYGRSCPNGCRIEEEPKR